MSDEKVVSLFQKTDPLKVFTRRVEPNLSLFQHKPEDLFDYIWGKDKPEMVIMSGYQRFDNSDDVKMIARLAKAFVMRMPHEEENIRRFFGHVMWTIQESLQQTDAPFAPFKHHYSVAKNMFGVSFIIHQMPEGWEVPGDDIGDFDIKMSRMSAVFIEDILAMTPLTKHEDD